MEIAQAIKQRRAIQIFSTTKDPNEVIDDPSVEIVVEVIGGIEPARSLILKAINSGKSVVTANKAVIARHGKEISDAAKKAGVYVLIEAAVGGGIPIIEPLKQSLCGNCVAFDISPRMDDCMPGETSDEDGRLGYCWMHHFKCHSARSCHTWAKGGPITKDEKSHNWQERGAK